MKDVFMILIIAGVIISIAFGLATAIIIPITYFEWKSYKNITHSDISFRDYFFIAPQINAVYIKDKTGEFNH